MKKIKIILYIAISAMFLGCESSEDGLIRPDFDDIEFRTIMHYLNEHEEDYSSFIKIVKTGKIAQALGGYNPDGQGYTLFLPNNDAIDDFIVASEQFESLDEMLNNEEFTREFCRYHVVNMSIRTNDFPFGAFAEPTLSGDYLSVNYIIESDSTYIKINNAAPVNGDVTKRNIELSNGIIHVINSALIPITFNSYDWLQTNSEYSIFLDAIDLTELAHLIDFNLKENENRVGVTVFVEADTIFHKRNIFSVDDLIQYVSPEDDDYTSELNGLNRFVSYHFLKGSFFIDDFVDENTLYFTHANISLNINGDGLDVKINDGKQVFDTIINNGDTTMIDEIFFNYDESNIISQSGAIHFIDQIMEVKRPSARNVQFNFIDREPILNEYRYDVGEFLLDNSEAFETLDWSGADLTFVSLGDVPQGLWRNHYLEANGDIVLTWKIPEIIRGSYNMFLKADVSYQDNAAIEVFLDGKKIGGIIDLSDRDSFHPWENIELGNIDITKYTEHTVEIRTLIPGRLKFGNVEFKIETND